jgi:hypothetical protein
MTRRERVEVSHAPSVSSIPKEHNASAEATAGEPLHAFPVRRHCLTLS